MIRKTIAVILTVAMIISSIVGAESVGAKTKKVSLSKKKLTLTVGKNVKLKLKNNKKKVKWSVSSKKVIKLKNKSKKGAIVKALKEGTAKVIAKIGKKKYVCRVIVKLEQKEVGNTRNDVNTPSDTKKDLGNQINPGVSSSENPNEENKVPEPEKTPEETKDEKKTFTATGIVRDASGKALPGIEIYFGTYKEGMKLMYKWKTKQLHLKTEYIRLN